MFSSYLRFPLSRRAAAPGANPSHLRWLPGLLLVVSALVLAPLAARGQTPAPELRIRLVRDGSSVVLERATDALRDELDALLDGDVRLEIADADWTLAGASRELGAALADDSLDAVVTFGALTARAVAQADALAHPTIVALAAPPAAHRLDPDDPRPWLARAGLLSLDADLARLQELAPVARVALLVDEAEMPGLGAPSAGFAQFEARYQIELLPVPVPPAPAPPLVELPADVDAAVLGLLLQSSDERRAEVIAAAAERAIPVVAALDPSDLAVGAAISTLPERVWTLRARHVALAVQALLEGAEPAGLRAPLPSSSRFSLNRDALRALGISPPFTVLAEATWVGGEDAGELARVSLSTFVSEVLARNPGLRADEQAVAIGESAVDRDRSVLLPQLNVEARGTWIDEDRAAGPTPPAEQTLAWSASLSQSVYSARGWGELHSEQALQEAREQTLVAQRLDLAVDAASRYIELLRARTAERIQIENLERVRANLELAQVREDVGSEGRDEVFRWEIDLARSQQDVARAIAARQRLETALNRLRAQPLDAPLAPAEDAPAELSLLATDAALERYFADPASLERLIAFSVERAQRGSPSLRALDARLEAAQTAVETSRRRFFAPELSLEAALSDRFAEAGAGTEGGVTIPGFTIPDDWDWSIALVARLPLSTGGGRFAELDGARASLLQLRAQRDEAALAIAGEVRTALLAASASHQSVVLSRRAAEAAEENLELVRDGYQRGALDVIRLVDAQTQSLVTALALSDASYQFLLDFLAVERAIGQVSFGPDDQTAASFLTDLAASSARAEGTSEGR